MSKLFNQTTTLAFILFTVFINGFISINMLEKNKKYYSSLMGIIKKENKELLSCLLTSFKLSLCGTNITN